MRRTGVPILIENILQAGPPVSGSLISRRRRRLALSDPVRIFMLSENTFADGICAESPAFRTEDGAFRSIRIFPTETYSAPS